MVARKTKVTSPDDTINRIASSKLDYDHYDVESFIGLTVGHLRRSAGFSRAELSKRSGVPVNTLKLYERGEMIPTVSAVYKIAETLNVNAIELITLSEVMMQISNHDADKEDM